MSAKEIPVRWRRRLAEGLDRVNKLLIACRKSGSVEAVHDLRVALRRARLLAFVGKPLLQKKAVKKFRSWAGEVLDALGSVRDCDVSARWMGQYLGSNSIANSVAERRDKLWRKARPCLSLRHKPELSLYSVNRIPGSNARKVVRRFNREIQMARNTVRQSTARFQKLKPRELHDLRRGVRRWRYLAEMASKRREKPRRSLKRLIAFQEALGQVQDLQVAIDLLSSMKESTDVKALLKAARREQRGWIECEHQRLNQLVEAMLEDTSPSPPVAEKSGEKFPD